MQWFKRPFTRSRIYRELSEEIQQHLAEKIDALMADGMSREDAQCAARREFGNVTRMEERGREAGVYAGGGANPGVGYRSAPHHSHVDQCCSLQPMAPCRRSARASLCGCN